MSESENVEEELITTEGGYQAIKRNGLYLRNSMEPKRITEDGETQEEYKERRKIVALYLKLKEKGTTLFQSLKYNPSLHAIVGHTYKKEK